MSDLLQKLIDEDFGYEHNSSVWGRSTKHSSLVVKEDEQLWFWNSRGLRGNVVDYLILVRLYDKRKAVEYVKDREGGITNVNERKESTSSPYEKLIEILWNNGKNNRDYWYSRKLKDSTIDTYKLGYYEGWNTIPMYENGQFVNFQLRRDIPAKRIGKWYRHGKTVMFNDGVLPFIDTVYITEGTVDSILLNQEGFPSVSANGVMTWRDDWYGLFSHIKNIYYVEDNDSAGREGAKKVSSSLGKYRVKIISYLGMKEKYDTVDFYRDGATKQDFKDKIASAKYIFELEDK